MRFDNAIRNKGRQSARRKLQSMRLGLEALESRELLAGDVVMFNDVGTGAGTNANATSYVANATASGPLLDVATGNATGMTLTTSHVGAAFGTGGNSPQAGTDAAEIFDGNVDFGSGTASLIEINGADSYTYTVGGMDSANLFDVAATAIRGNEFYFNRWTLFRLEGAESFTAAHSDGNGIVVDGLAANEVAVHTGINHLAGQGFVAEWLDIDPGADGEIQLVAEQYTGATPGVGGGTANGIAGYAPSAFRLIEHDFDAPVVANSAATSVLATSADIGALLSDTGGLDSTLSIYWGDTDGGTNPANWGSVIPFGQVDVGAFTSSISTLTSETEYFYRAFAENAAGGTWANVSSSFTTASLSLPSLVTEPVENVGASFANISGVVTDPGGEAPSISIFYGTTDGGTDANSWPNEVEVGERLDSFSAGLSGLNSETEYFYRARATNGAGTSWSPVTGSFTTTDTPSVVINEFVSQNNSTLTTRTRASAGEAFTGEQDTPDWIELRNLSGAVIEIGGMHLTDNSGDPNQWQFPAGAIIPANGYLVVFASGENILDPALDQEGNYHTNFSLNSSGEYLALTQADGRIVDEVTSVPPQVADLSYGRFGDEFRYFSDTTPEAANSSTTTGLVGDTSFSVDRGFYNAAFDVEITTATEDATIRYTLDGSPPSLTDGTVYSGPITIDKTSTLRAIAYKPGLRTTNVDTQTYIFVDDVIQQTPASTIAAGFPSSWKGTSPDYGIDPDVVGPNDDFGGRYADTIRDDLKALPTLSIVGDIDDLFGTNGVYTNPDSSTNEKPVSFEMITADGSEEFQINAGVKIQGGAFRSWGLTKKKSLRMKFKAEYGASKLRHPLFGEDAAQEFDTVTLRMEANDGWQWNGANGQPQFLRDELGRRLQSAMGQPASHGRNVHVYLNGVYWGMYNMVERPDQSFGESYIGGDKDDWDGLNSGSPINADTTARANRARDAWNELVSLSGDVANATTEADRTAAFMKVQGLNPDGSNNPNWESYVDVDNMIDYFIVNWYAGNSDWPFKNYYVGRENSADSEGFKFFMWDAEWSLFLRSTVTSNRINESSGVQQPISRLRDSAEFRLQFADKVQQHLVNPGGPLYVDPDNPDYDPEHPERNMPAAMYAGLSELIFDGLVAESARWGDQHRATPYTRDNEWQNEYDHIMEDWFPDRTRIFIDQLTDAGLYPTVRAAEYQVNGVDQHGGAITAGDLLTLSAPASIVTTDSTLIPLDSEIKAFVPTDNSMETGAGPLWNDVALDSTNWITGTGAAGFGADYTDQIGTNVAGAWIASNGVSLYSRYEFDLPADFVGSDIERMQLRMKYDDGYAVYLNGQLIHTKSTPDPLAWDGNATAKRLNLLNTLPTVFETTNFGNDEAKLLQPGENVLAIHVFNHATDTADLLVRAELTISDDVGIQAPIIYTLDGSDPREFGGASAGTTYTSGIELTETTTVSSRAFVNGQWSALNRTTFVANPVEPGDLVVSEINYNPADPTETELASIGTLDNDDFEFVEVFNRGASSIDLLGAEFVNGIDFEFSEFELDAGERVVIVRDADAFALRYGAGVTVLGEFSGGSLNNGGEQLTIADRDGNVLVDFEYDDSQLWPQRADGVGGTLELTSPSTTPSDELGKAYHWQGSTVSGGSPAAAGADAPGVIISEVLANTTTPADALDAIELHNPTGLPINVGGWYLSDSGSTLAKFQIPAGTSIEAGGYFVFDESDFNPTPANPGANDFSISGSNGEDIWLTRVAGGNVQFIDEITFGSSYDGVSWIPAPVGHGGVSSALATLGCSNRAPMLPTLVVSEVNYNPGEPSAAALSQYADLVEDDLEFIEIHNATLGPVDLTSWRLRGGADISFADGTVIAADEAIVVISFNPDAANNVERTAAFRTHYGIGANVRLFGGFSGQLSDSGEAVRLQAPDSPNPLDPLVIPRVVVDEVIYDDRGAWPSADGTGESISRNSSTFFGSVGSAWSANSPTPGTVAAVNQMGDITGDGLVNVDDITALADAVLAGNQQSALDIDNNGIVDSADVQMYLTDVLSTLPGDTNLDGAVDGSDFNRWNDHKFQSCNMTLATGDMNFDSVVDASDFNIWSENRFTSVDGNAAAVDNARVPRAAAAQDRLEVVDRVAALDGIDTTVPVEAADQNADRQRNRYRHTSVQRRAAVGDATVESTDELFRRLSDWF